MYKKIIFLLSLLILVGCQTHTETKQIDLKSAQSIAISRYPNSQISSITYNESATTPSYSLRLVDDTTDYEVSISAIDGSLTEYSRTPVSKTSITKINLADAKAMALELHPGEIVECELDTSNNIPYYEITINDGTYDYEIEINALTGEILELDHDISTH